MSVVHLGRISGGGTQKEDEVVWILYCISVPNADKGRGFQNSENFADVIYGWSQKKTSIAISTTCDIKLSGHVLCRSKWIERKTDVVHWMRKEHCTERRDVSGGNRFQEAAPHDESAEGRAGDGGAEGGGVAPGDCPPRHCHALPHLSHSEVGIRKLLTISAFYIQEVTSNMSYVKEIRRLPWIKHQHMATPWCWLYLINYIIRDVWSLNQHPSLLEPTVSTDGKKAYCRFILD